MAHKVHQDCEDKLIGDLYDATRDFQALDDLLITAGYRWKCEHEDETMDEHGTVAFDNYCGAINRMCDEKCDNCGTKRAEVK